MQKGTLAQRAITPVHPNGCPGKQGRLCSGHPKVHFGTIAEGSWEGGGGGGVHGGSSELSHFTARAFSLSDSLLA